MKIRNTTETASIELQMTPMIDIVFQLLIFFIMTFKIAALEGDFNIRMPIAAPNADVADIDPLPPMKLVLHAAANGDIASIVMGERLFDSFDGPKNSLHGYVTRLADKRIGGDAGPGDSLTDAEIEIECDYHLRYEHIVAAITAISGHRTPSGDIVKLIERIKFAPPKPPE